ncbi:hypothetical protein [Kitasatospora sp. NPDC088783]|uniref:hypothetical protein n=1 Tax=Kitasatospora sp. NPDC088783 TaxID=3364077 RepID=UPI00381F06CE
MEALTEQRAKQVAEAASITPPALRRYMAAYLVCEDTAKREIRQLLERFLRTGRLARRPGSGTVRVRNHRLDDVNGDAYTFILSPGTETVLAFSGPAQSYFGRPHQATDDLAAAVAANRQRVQEQLQRKADRMEQQEQVRAARENARQARIEAARPDPWPLVPEGFYDRNGQPAVDWSRPPLAGEAQIRRAGRSRQMLFHSDALNSVYFREVPIEERHEALARVLDVMMRTERKGAIAVAGGAITVTNRKITLTLAPHGMAVLAAKVPSEEHMPSRYRRDKWPLDSRRNALWQHALNGRGPYNTGPASAVGARTTGKPIS